MTPVRHPVIDVDDLDEAYWQGVRALWNVCDIERVRRSDPSVIVPAHGVVIRGRRLAEALQPLNGARCDAVATPEELSEALASVHGPAG